MTTPGIFSSYSSPNLKLYVEVLNKVDVLIVHFSSSVFEISIVGLETHIIFLGMKGTPIINV